MSKNTITFNIDWNNEVSVKVAEAVKAELERHGWEQINHFGGEHHSAVVYGHKGEYNDH